MNDTENSFTGLGRGVGDIVLTEGDIVVSAGNGKNADPCTATNCMWPKSSDGNVYIPYVITYPYSTSLIWNFILISYLLYFLFCP